LEAKTKQQSSRSTPASFEVAWSISDQIEGWLAKDQAHALFEAARRCQAGSWIVEIGSHHGKSTVAMALGKSDATGMVSVDPYPERPFGHGDRAYDALCDNLDRTGLSEAVHLVRESSTGAADAWPLISDALDSPAIGTGIGMLFLDGLHDRSSVLADLEHWEPYVLPGGLVYLHDAFFRLGVTSAVLQRYLLSTAFRYLGSVGHLAMFRQELSSDVRALRSNIKMLKRLTYLGRNLAVTSALRNPRLAPILRVLPPEDHCDYGGRPAPR
jgi:predicted O-methyltransferase YrrM